MLVNKRRSQVEVETIIDGNDPSVRESLQSLSIGTNTNIQVGLGDAGQPMYNRKETVGTVRMQNFDDDLDDMQSRSDLESAFSNYGGGEPELTPQLGAAFGQGKQSVNYPAISEVDFDRESEQTISDMQSQRSRTAAAKKRPSHRDQDEL